MPVRAIHVFASQKGGTGKTLLSVQIACTYADANPSEKVLFMDFTELGDGTKRLFGGFDFVQGREEEFGKVFGLLTGAREAEEAEERRDEAASRGLFGRFTGIFGRSASGAGLKVEDYAVQCSPLNRDAALPDNLYLISSGGSQIDSEEVEEKVGMRNHDDRRRICESLRRVLDESDHTWRVFIDTDGDRRPVPLTVLGYLLADFCVVPIQADECDFQRVEQMMAILHGLHSKGEALCKLQLMAWNKVQLYKGDPSDIGHFTPPKISIDTIQHLKLRLDKMKTKHADLFAPSFGDVLVKDFPDSVCMPASANGLAFCRMQPGKIKTRGGVPFDIKKEQLEGCVDGIMKILEKLEPDGPHSK